MVIKELYDKELHAFLFTFTFTPGGKNNHLRQLTCPAFIQTREDKA